MKTTPFRCLLSAALLSAGLLQSATATAAGTVSHPVLDAPTAAPRPDNPAAHPSFTVRVTGKGRLS